MFTSLSLENFKSWRSIPEMRLAPITGLFGANSSGKSSILQFFLLLKQTVEATDRATVLEFGNDKTPVNLGSFKDVVFGHDCKHLSFSIAWKSKRLSKFVLEDSLKKPIDKFDFSCEIVEKDSGIAVERFTYRLDADTFTMQKTSPHGNDYYLSCEAKDFPVSNTKKPVPAPIKFFGFPKQVYAYYQAADSLSYLQLDFENLFEGIHYLGPLRDFPQRQYLWSGSRPTDIGFRGELAIHAIIASKEKNGGGSNGSSQLEYEIARWLQEWGLIRSFSVEPLNKDSNIYEVRVKKTANSTPVLLTDVGFGVSQVLPVLTLCYHVPEGSVIILEQPEIHLHPSVQAGLADLFIEVAYRRNLQIIFESHSEHLLRRLQRRIAEEQFRNVFYLPENIALYFCKFQDTESQLEKLQVNELGDIENWPDDFFGDEIGEMNAMLQAAMKQEKAP